MPSRTTRTRASGRSSASSGDEHGDENPDENRGPPNEATPLLLKKTAQPAPGQLTTDFGAVSTIRSSPPSGTASTSSSKKPTTPSRETLSKNSSADSLRVVDGSSANMGEKIKHFAAENGKIAISKTLAVIVAVVFVGVTVAVGLLVYNYAEPGSGAAGGLPDGDGTTSTSQSSTPAPPALLKDVRLPTHLEPIHYDVRLLPHVNAQDNWLIEGYTKIYMLCKQAGRNITVHINEVVIDESTVVVADSDTEEVLQHSKPEYDKTRQFFIVPLSRDLEPGKHYSLEIGAFNATLNDQLAGFYRSRYDHQGETRYMAVTQFQATDARRAFPCFDEPGMKAQFNITLGRLDVDNWSSQSNMDQIETGIAIPDRPGYVWDKYNLSVKMSTYLVAFAVSQFENRTSSSSETFKVWARPDMMDRTAFAADEGAKILKYFEWYFNISYPLPKTDMFALTDFSAGAMENWGLVTYREEYLLYDPTGRTTSATLLQRIIYIIAHELSHQWFGNLVTPTWWTDLWLNEGFASYVEYLGSQHSRQKWKWMQLFVVSEVQDVMRIDSLESSHPIYQEVFNPDQITELFDRISYGKGASIIRMMDHFLTTETFRKGLIEYLNAKRFSNAVTEDLWNFLNEAATEDNRFEDADLTVNAIMRTWTELTGYPVVKLTRSPTSNTATLTQTRFLLQESATKQDGDGKWFVPINFNAQAEDFNNTAPKLWLKPTDGVRELTATDLPSSLNSWRPNEAEGNWVILNAQETGYYRVNYDDANWRMIQKQLETDHEVIATENRAQIIDDAFNLARAGLLDYRTALSLTTYLANETEYIPWRATTNALSYIDRMLERSSGYGDFLQYVQCLTRKQLKDFETLEQVDAVMEDDVTQIFKDVLIQGAACKYDVEKCSQDASAEYAKWQREYDETDPDKPTISPNVKSVVYCYGVKNGGVGEWEHAWMHYNKTNLASEKSSMLSAMSCTKEVWLLSRYLEKTFEPNSMIRSQDAARAFANIAGSVIGRSLAFDYLVNNFPYIKENFGSGISAMNSFVNPFATFNTDSEAARMRDFRDQYANDLGSATRAVDQTIESIEINAQWMKKYEKTVVDWFKEHTACAA